MTYNYIVSDMENYLNFNPEDEKQIAAVQAIDIFDKDQEKLERQLEKLRERKARLRDEHSKEFKLINANSKSAKKKQASLNKRYLNDDTKITEKIRNTLLSKDDIVQRFNENILPELPSDIRKQFLLRGSIPNREALETGQISQAIFDENEKQFRAAEIKILQDKRRTDQANVKQDLSASQKRISERKSREQKSKRSEKSESSTSLGSPNLGDLQPIYFPDVGYVSEQDFPIILPERSIGSFPRAREFNPDLSFERSGSPAPYRAR